MKIQKKKLGGGGGVRGGWVGGGWVGGGWVWGGWVWVGDVNEELKFL